MSLKRTVRTLRKWLQAIGKPRRVVYTCLFGHSERFLDQKFERDERTDFVCFTDDAELRSDFWEMILVPKSLLEPHRRSKGFKHRPHLFFPNHECSLYIDNTVELTISPSDLFRHLKKSSSSLMMFKHHERNCVYDEAEIVKSLRLDDLDLIANQMDFYRCSGYPKQNGLYATTVMLRKHNDPEVKAAMSEWHDQVLRYSKRDQLSFDVVRHFCNLRVDPLSGSLLQNDFFKWPVVLGNARLPRDFDESEYLKLNADVLNANIDPRKHYLEYGIAEGRQYRLPAIDVVLHAETFRVDARDERGRELQLSKRGQLNESTYAMWESLLRETDWTDIVDIGANYGEMLVKAQFPKSAKIIAIEPNPRIFPLLRENLQNAAVECDCLAIAVSDCVGVAELCLDLRWSGLSTLEKAQGEPSADKEIILVPTMSIDVLMGGDFDLSKRKLLFKIDVEGHEISVLKGMQRVTAEGRELAALVEVLHLDKAARAMILENFSVEVYDLGSQSLTKVEPASLDHFDRLLQSDFIYKNDIVIRPMPK